MIYSLCIYNRRSKRFLPRCYGNVKESKVTGWFARRTKMGHKLLLHFHNYAVAFIFAMVLASYAWFASLANYINSTKDNLIIFLYPFLLIAVVLFHGKYRETGKTTIEQSMSKAIMLYGLSVCMAASIICIGRISPGSAITKYFALEQAVIYNGVVLHGVNYSNTRTLHRIILFSTVLYFLGAAISLFSMYRW
ncbi:hypothetical protein NEMIN01_1715 [Nematocida minor]|uniref:uncharacterized protein n=1 Tax=Nematocida minor TaxID=1912983 RepID=UPI00221FEFA1|nr:uncharacterized protein NEMIN01_1715 [Nematocida minor]KAI5191860.1 hypothetical protein NEMIN01_1715 [Nematocida minor]